MDERDPKINAAAHLLGKLGLSRKAETWRDQPYDEGVAEPARDPVEGPPNTFKNTLRKMRDAQEKAKKRIEEVGEEQWRKERADKSLEDWARSYEEEINQLYEANRRKEEEERRKRKREEYHRPPKREEVIEKPEDEDEDRL